ncbi:gustatory receptor 5a for trehalose-like [Thrips palmi]|uniref:Gustatory receptor n=1 Tax=Thrips palmi TaxID=161013 RepID=A0A6P8ZMA8_THRPL|nr:gustatory receptor 5a for trehalose-like [Thrips palmi]
MQRQERFADGVLVLAVKPKAGEGEDGDVGDDVFMRGFKPALRVAQFFGLLPVSKPADPRRASFRWVSPRTALAVVIIVGAVLEACAAAMRMVDTGIKVNTSVHAMFFSLTAVAQMLFLRMSCVWPQLMLDLASVDDKCLRAYGEPPRLRARMLSLTAGSFLMAVVEHGLSNAGTLFYVWPCYYRGGLRLVWQGYFLTKYLKTFQLFTFATWKAVLLLWLQIINVFVWNFMDLFIALFAMGLSARFRLVNSDLEAVLVSKGQNNEFWRKKRKHYNALAELVRRVDVILGPLILVSYATDLYFICLQLLSVVNPSGVSLYHKLFFVFSMAYLLLRMTFMTYVAANINEESRRPREVLFSIPTAAYSVEVERLLVQVLTDNIALTGCNFFSISRSFLLKIAGTIVTYVVVLVQFSGKDANPDAAQSNGTVSCTCEDIKVYTC